MVQLNETVVGSQERLQPREGMRIFVLRDLWEVRKRLDFERSIMVVNSREHPVDHPIREDWIWRKVEIDARIRDLRIPFSSYPEFLDERSRGSLFIESSNTIQPQLFYKESLDIEFHEKIPVVAYEEGVKDSGKWVVYCHWTDVALWWTEPDIDQRKIEKKEGPAYLVDPSAGLDRQFRPVNGDEVDALIFGIWIPGKYDGLSDSIVSERTGSAYPFCFASRWHRFSRVNKWKRERAGSSWTGPFEHLAGPRAWQQLDKIIGYDPNLTPSFSQLLREQFERESIGEQEEKQKAAVQQLQDEWAIVNRTLKEARDVEHEIVILMQFRERGKVIDTASGVENNSYKAQFMLYDTFISWIDSGIQQRKQAIQLRYSLKHEFETDQLAQSKDGRSIAIEPTAAERFPFSKRELYELVYPTDRSLTYDAFSKRVDRETPVEGIALETMEINGEKRISGQSYHAVRRAIEAKNEWKRLPS